MFTGRRRVAVITTMTGALIAGLAGCGQAVAPGAGQASSPPPPTATGSSPGPPATPAITPPPSVSPSQPRTSAADQLAGFFAAAAAADAKLKHTAALINEGIGTTSMRFSPAALAAAAALSMAPTAHAIPAGLPAELLRRVLLVYSDLESRTLSLKRIDEAAGYPAPLPISSEQGRWAFGCLRNGAPAAARFGTDLAAARALARATGPIAVASPGSRAAAELALRVLYINLGNGGCDSCGGAVFTTLTPLIWHREDLPGGDHSDGTIGGIAFTADYQAGHGWQVQIRAC